jgi:hypothetical protein
MYIENKYESDGIYCITRHNNIVDVHQHVYMCVAGQF